MAKIKKLPGAAVISGFKGVIDYYVWKGIACARKWPRSPGHKRAPAVEARWPVFATASRLWNDLSPEIQDAYYRMSAGTRWSGRDIFIKGYLNAAWLHLE
ncbi:unnamed protein product [marine sediment metagenome]|uniref:Uncharacterized protein n=1 Tax=marine sediment metagenome TaxID=412755 RepID=X1RRL3_9ZZZZ